MLTLLLMLVTFLGVGLALLGLRQLRWELNSQSVKIYSQIREREEILPWDRTTTWPEPASA